MSKGPGAAERYVLAYLEGAALRWEHQHLATDIAAARAAMLDPDRAYQAVDGLARPSRSQYETVRRAIHLLDRDGRIAAIVGGRLRCSLLAFRSHAGSLRYARRHRADLLRYRHEMRPEAQVDLGAFLRLHDIR